MTWWMIMPENPSSNETFQREAASHERIPIFPIMYRQKRKRDVDTSRGRQANSNIVGGRRRKKKKEMARGGGTDVEKDDQEGDLWEGSRESHQKIREIKETVGAKRKRLRIWRQENGPQPRGEAGHSLPENRDWRKLKSDEKDRRQKSNNAKGLCNRNSRPKNRESQK